MSVLTFNFWPMPTVIPYATNIVIIFKLMVRKEAQRNHSYVWTFQKLSLRDFAKGRKQQFKLYNINVYCIAYDSCGEIIKKSNMTHANGEKITSSIGYLVVIYWFKFISRISEP